MAETTESKRKEIREVLNRGGYLKSGVGPLDRYDNPDLPNGNRCDYSVLLVDWDALEEQERQCASLRDQERRELLEEEVRCEEVRRGEREILQRYRDDVQNRELLVNHYSDLYVDITEEYRVAGLSRDEVYQECLDKGIINKL